MSLSSDVDLRCDGEAHDGELLKATSAKANAIQGKEEERTAAAVAPWVGAT